MELTSQATLPVLILGLMLGLAALALMANELGRRARLSLPARVVLAGGLGMGVLAVAIKVGIIALLSQSDGRALARAGTAMRGAAEALFAGGEAAAPEPEVGAEPLGYRTWRALPGAARDPRGNRTTPEKVALGRRLFNDARLSVDGSVSCASCHVLDEGGDDNMRVSMGVRGQTGDRNAPSVLNAAFLTRLFWDGRAGSLEQQAEGPLLNPVEMAMPSLDEVEARVRADPDYGALFAAAFPGARPITGRNIVRAIAAYQRSLITPDTPYDRFVRGEDAALSPAALRGMALFDAVGCRSCHVDPVFSAAGTEKPMGVYRSFPVYPEGNPYVAKYGLLVDGGPGRFRVPSLRNVALTAPYFHNGSVRDLDEAIRVMAVSQLGRRISDNPLDDIEVLATQVADDRPGRNLSLVGNRALSGREVADIAAFLRALTADRIPR
jgi:cytochrome c peroxidase